MPRVEILQAIIGGIAIPVVVIVMGVLARRISNVLRLGWRDWVLATELVLATFALCATMSIEWIWFQLGYTASLTLTDWKYLIFFGVIGFTPGFLLAVIDQHQTHVRINPADIGGGPAPLLPSRMITINLWGAVPLGIVVLVILI